MKTRYIYGSISVILMITNINATVYESGKGVNNWGMLDALPAKATSIYDTTINSDVIEFNGKGFNSAYIYGYGTNEWNNDKEKIIKWSMKYSEDYAVYVRAKTTKGFRFFEFTPNGTSGKKEVYIKSILGDNTKDGEWHDFTIDLEALLKKYEPDNSILKVNGIIFRGSGRVDDIELVPIILKKELKALIIKDSKLYSIDADSKIKLLSDNISNSEEDKIITPKIINNIAYFVIDDGINGKELWRSDGSIEGTNILKDINPSGDSSPSNLTILNNTLYFSANNGENGIELWKSDGSESGTKIVKDINLNGDANINYISTLNNNLYFSANDGVHGTELWKSNGTSSGTLMIKDINPDINSSTPKELIYMNGILYFSADDGIHGNELWRSDGTESGTYMVKNYFSEHGGIVDDYSIQPRNIKNLNNTLYFEVSNPPSCGYDGSSLWQSDGTEEGTHIVDYTNCGGEEARAYPIDNIDNIIFFVMGKWIDTSTHSVLWRSDGTESGTNILNTYPKIINHLKMNNILYFTADNEYNGEELWRSDGTVNGTYMIKNINQNTYSCIDETVPCPYNYGSNPKYLTNINNNLYFFANDGINGNELWKSNGTEDGTKIVILD